MTLLPVAPAPEALDDLDRPSSAPRDLATVAVLGLGYVGLPTATALADAGLRVLGVDVSRARLADIAAGAVDLLAGDLALLERHRGDALRCGDDTAVLEQADAVIVCVPTPVDGDFNPDLRPLQRACATARAHVQPGQLIVLTSTTSVGSTQELLVEPLERRGLVVGRDVFIAFAPERIDPGNVTHPQATVPRVVGGVTERCAQRAEELLGRIAPIHRVSSPEAAELTKLHENTFRAVNIAYAYELARAASTYGLDAREIVDAAASKPFGFMAFYPSAGVGGHCIPCDPHYLLKPLADRGIESPIVAAAMKAIERRPHDVVRRSLELLDAHGVDHDRARVLVVGAAYKPGVADRRQSPAVDIIRTLLDAGIALDYHDPLVASLELDGRPLASVEAPDAAAYDLVVLACLHPQTAPFWQVADTPVLDCTYRTLAATDPRRRTI